MPTIRPLPRSLDPVQGESLAGFLLRVAHRLDLAPSRIAVLTGLGWQAPGRSVPIVPVGRLLHLDTTTAARFAQASRLRADEVAGLCLDSLRDRYPPLDVNDVNYELNGVRRQADGVMGLARWVFTRSTRYCPQCLAGDGSPIQQAHGGAWQKVWHLPVVFACTVHRQLLSHQCPQCRQPVHSRHGGGLLPRLHDATLHPAQCRTTIGRGAHWRTQSACGTRLDRPAPKTLTGQRQDPSLEPELELERLLAVQYKLLALLGLEPNANDPPEVISVGRPATAAQYFVDVRLLVGLLQASWPQARPLAEPWMGADTIDRHLGQHRQQASPGRRAGRRTLDVAVHDRPPVAAAACGGLLALADQLLTLDDLPAAREHLDPMIAQVSARRDSWVEHIRSLQPHCSDGLRTAIAPQTHRWRGDYAAAAQVRRFGPQHIPQYLPADWYDRYFQSLTGLNPRLLRRLAAIKLVQLAQGGSQQAAARQLGLPPGRYAAAAGYRVQRWARDQANAAKLHVALHTLAAELDATPASDLIDYGRRRAALQAWSIPRDDWHELATELRGRQSPTAQLLTDWGDHKRLTASVLVWTRVTQGEHVFAPLVLHEQQRSRRNQIARVAWEVARGSGPGRPQHHYVALMTALDTYADQLAARIDAGPPVRLGESAILSRQLS
jgi:hypothetical protein